MGGTDHMIDYGELPSNQMQLELEGFTDEGKALYDQAWAWIKDNSDAFSTYMEIAREQCRDGAKASPNYCLQAMRNRKHRSVRNALAAPLARIAMELDDSLKFRLAKSKVDGFAGVTL